MPRIPLSKEMLASNDHIPMIDILQDKTDTEVEIVDLRDEEAILMSKPHENKTRLYFIKGKISARVDFIWKLDQLLEYRKKNK